MKLRKIISTLTLSCFSGSTLILSGCVGNADKPVISNTSITASANQSASSNNDYNGLWSNVTYVDTKSSTSNLDVFTDNRSDSDMTLVGCDNSDKIANHLQEISMAHQYAPQVAASARWSEKYPNGIYDKTHLEDNFIHFHDTGKSDYDYHCYYSVDSGKSGQPLFFSMTNHLHNEATPSSTTINKPEKDAEQDNQNLSTVIGVAAGRLGSLGFLMA